MLAALALVVLSNSPDVHTVRYRGSFGGDAVAVELVVESADVHGRLRFGTSTDELPITGKAKPADAHGVRPLELVINGGKAPGGTLTAGLTSRLALTDASWKPGGAPKPMVVSLDGTPGFPDGQAFDGLRLVPQFWSAKHANCSDDSEYPALAGAKDAAKQSALDASWKKDWGGPGCGDAKGRLEPPWEYRTRYEVLTQKPGRLVSLRFTAFSFVGGLHGNTMTTCQVLDLKTLTPFALNPLLTDEGRKALSKKVSEQLKKDVTIKKDDDLCLEDDDIAVDFRDYEVTSHAEGPPFVKVPKALYESWMVHGPQTDALFGRAH